MGMNPVRLKVALFGAASACAESTCVEAVENIFLFVDSAY